MKDRLLVFTDLEKLAKYTPIIVYGDKSGIYVSKFNIKNI